MATGTVFDHGLLPRHEALELQRSADVLLVIKSDLPEPGILTGKFFEYLTAQRPILIVGKGDQELNTLVQRISGVQVVPHNPGSILSGLRKLQGSDEVPRAVEIAPFLWKNQFAALLERIERLPARTTDLGAKSPIERRTRGGGHQLPHRRPEKRILAILCSPFYLDKGSAVRARSNLISMAQLRSVDVVTYPVGRPLAVPGLNILRARAPGYRRAAAGPSLTKPYADVMVFFRACGHLWRHKQRYAFISGEDVEGGLVGLALSLLFRLPYVFSMYNPFENTLRPYTTNAFLLGVARAVDRLLERQRHIIVEWEYERERLLSGGARAHIHVVPDAFPPEASPPKNVALPASYICYTGNAKPYQGLDFLLRSFQRLSAVERERCPLVLVGPTEEQVARFGLSADIWWNVRVLGPYSLSETNHIIAKAAFCVLPRTRDGAPGMKVLHYFSQNQPTLATDLQCNRHFIDHGTNGELIPLDERLFSEALRRWIHDAGYVESMRRNVANAELGSQALANRRMAKALEPLVAG